MIRWTNSKIYDRAASWAGGEQTWVRYTNKLIILILVFLLLACISYAAPLQLSGNSGRSILGTINVSNSSNETNTLNETDLWSWGKLPVGHFINDSGKLAARPIDDDGLVVVSPRAAE
jgi:hypothetical protein